MKMIYHNSGSLVAISPSPARGTADRLLRRLIGLGVVLAGLWFPTAGPAQYTYTTNNSAITITGYTGAGGALTITNTITGLPVTSIGDNAFLANSSLTSVTIPNSVTTIGAQAFENCTSLTSATLGTNTTSIGAAAFWNCSTLTNVTIPGSVTNIGYEAFVFCGSLTSVIIPASVTSLGAEAFQNCSSLTNITVDGQNVNYSSLDGILFDKNQTALIQCPPNKLVGNYSVPASVTSIIDYAFYNCSHLTNLTLPSNLASIGANEFYNTHLTSLTIPASVTNIGINAFYGCQSLSNIIVDAQNTNYSSLAGILFDKNQTLLIQCPQHKAGSFAIPGSVTNIGYQAFVACTLITNITLPDGVISIGAGAFEYDSGLTSITIPTHVTSLGIDTFYSCSSLTNITLGASITNIGYAAFNNCLSLPNVVIPASVTSLGSYAFNNCTALTGVYFLGNAPGSGLDSTVFTTDENATAYYLPRATGFGHSFDGLQTVLWGSAPFAMIIATANPTNGGTVSGGGTYAVGTNVQLIAMAANGWAFTSWNDSNSNATRSVNVLVGGAAYTAYFQRQTATITVQANPANGGTVSGSGTYFVGTNVQITATASNGWTCTGWSDGGAPAHTITVPVTNITFTANFAVCSYALAAASTNVAASAGSGSVNLTAGTSCAWTATNNVSWLTITGSASGTGNGTVSYTVAANSGNCTNRSGTLTIGGQIFTVNQTAGTGSYLLATASTNVAATAGSGNVNLTAGTGCAWTATNNVSWLTITGGASGTGNGTVSYTVAANSGNCTNRSGTLTIGGQTFTVNQTAGTGSYQLAPARTNVAATAGSGSVNLTAGTGCAWTATNNVSWLTITGGASGTGNGTISYTVADNSDNCTNRSGTLTIGSQTFTVNQTAGSGSYALAAASTNLAASAGSGSVGLTAGTGCVWTATSSTNWIHTGSNGTGSGTVSYTVDTNPDSAPRNGTITVQGQTFSINQAAAPCLASLVFVTTNVTASGGNGSVPVTAGSNCTWTATNNVRWLIITAGESGTGTGTVSYIAADNSGNCTNRSGTLTIGGQTFTVNQLAGSGSYGFDTASTNVAASASSGSVSLTAGIGCAWTATSSTNWIHTGSNGTGSGTVNYIVDANPAGSPRTGTISVQEQIFTVSQAAATATIIVQANPTMGGTGIGSGTYTVGTNIPISATANRGWKFTGWSDGNSNVSRTVSATLGGATYTAYFENLFTGGAPAILTPPVITNSLLVVGNQFVVLVGETNVFTVGAIDPVDNNLLQYRWNFGDGQTSAWSAVALATHVYATNDCGPYTASVTVSNTQAAISSNLNVSAACQLGITKLQLGVSFIKTNTDSATLIAKLELPGVTNVIQLTNALVRVDIGDVQVLFTLDNKGRGGSVPGTCRLVYTKPTKKLAGYWTATIALSKGYWRSPWAAYGLDSASHKGADKYSVTVPVVLLVGGDAFAAEKQLHYIATPNKTGTAK